MNTIPSSNNCQEKYTKKCPRCETLINYKHSNSLEYSISHNVICKKCIIKSRILLRRCPLCNREIVYTNYRNCKNAESRKSICKKCATTIYSNKDTTKLERSLRMRGKNHPMYGKPSSFLDKHHSIETKKKLSLDKVGIPLSQEHRDKIIEYAKAHDNPMKGRSVYSVWLEKYGKEESDKRMLLAKEKWSIASSGKKNPMYGKPSPKGAGQGWKGWYKETHFFRSLRELSYMIYLDEHNITWSSGELSKFKAKYIDYKGNARTTRPDFFVNENKLVEIKPKKLHTSPSVILKKFAMEKFCKENDYTYELTDINIDHIKIKKYFNDKLVRFMGKYEKKFLEYIPK